jgi:hypothetical protein
MKKKGNRRAVVWLAGLAVPLLLGYLLVWSHDVSLWQMSRSIAAVSHPPNTKRISSVKDLGLLAGNGNHCDYFVAEMRSYNNLTRKEIEAWYKNTKIWNPLKWRFERVSIGVIENNRIRMKLKDEDWIGLPDYLRSHFKSRWPQPSSSQKFYFVAFLDLGNETGCDLRCL